MSLTNHYLWLFLTMWASKNNWFIRWYSNPQPLILGNQRNLLPLGSTNWTTMPRWLEIMLLSFNEFINHFLIFDLTQFSTLLLKEQFRVSPSKDIVSVLYIICLYIVSLSVCSWLSMSVSVSQTTSWQVKIKFLKCRLEN